MQHVGDALGRRVLPETLQKVAMLPHRQARGDEYRRQHPGEQQEEQPDGERAGRKGQAHRSCSTAAAST
jgi:hypothetical protein